MEKGARHIAVIGAGLSGSSVAAIEAVRQMIDSKDIVIIGDAPPCQTFAVKAMPIGDISCQPTIIENNTLFYEGKSKRGKRKYHGKNRF